MLAFLRVLHRWTGLAIAAIVLAVSVSGGLLLFRDAYYRAAYPPVAAPFTPMPPAGRAAVLSAIDGRWADDRPRLIKFPREGMNAFHVWFEDGSEAFVDPSTGELIARWHWSSDAAAFLFELHAHLLSEPAGTVINGLTALIVVFMGLTGLVLWWPRRRRGFRLGGLLPPSLKSGDMLRSHAAAGVLTVLPITVFAFTGAAIVFYDEAEAVVTAWLDARPAEQPDARVPPRDAPHRPWIDVLSALDGALPEGETVFLYPGTEDNARLMVRKRMPGEWHPNGRSYVLIDPYTATVVQTIDARSQGAGTRLMHAVYPVHAAKVGGAWLAMGAGIAALGLSWMAAGGAWAYLGRIRSSAARRGRLPMLLTARE